MGILFSGVGWRAYSQGRGRVRYALRPAARRAGARKLLAAARPPARIDGAITLIDRRPSEGLRFAGKNPWENLDSIRTDY